VCSSDLVIVLLKGKGSEDVDKALRPGQGWQFVVREDALPEARLP